jgi:hypothetical protein
MREVPDNHVIAVLKSSNEAVLQEKLVQAGYPEILFMGVEEFRTKVDPDAVQANPLARLLHRLVNHLSEQIAYLEQYQEEARRGNRIITVQVQDDDDAHAVGQILAEHGAVNIRSFGRLVVHDLTPETNPSASSDQVP